MESSATMESSAPDPAALRALADRALLRRVYSFVPSVESELRAFEQAAGPLLRDARLPDGRRPAPFKWDGLLAQAAMFLGDREALDALIHVNTCRRHRDKPQQWALTSAMHGGVCGGRLDLLDYLLAKLPDRRVEPDLMRVAIQYGGRDAIDWVYSLAPRQLLDVDAQLVDELAKDGRLDAIRWLCDHGLAATFSPRTLDLAAGSGSLALVQFLLENWGEQCSTEAMDRAATCGHLDMVTFLHRRRREGCTARAMDGAARNGHLEVVRFLHAHRREGCTAAALNFAATNRHLEVVRFLVERRTEGCLFEARNCSLLHGYTDQAAYLFSRMRTDLFLCSVRMHATGPGLRRCQVPAPVAHLEEEDA